jgi:threonine/homoserine/homoserine lactone efflux protein
MILLRLLIKGFLAGLAIAAPVGPANVFCASQTLSKGRKAGLLAGLGVATADTVYGAIAGFSITFVIDFLRREEFWVRVIGGILLVGIGIVYFRNPPQPFEIKPREESAHSAYVSAFLLTLTNPTTILSFLAVLAAMGMGEKRPWSLSFVLVGGIFCGSMLWWIVLVEIVNHLRDRFTHRTAGLMNRIAGIAIGAFGLLTFLLGILSK